MTDDKLKDLLADYVAPTADEGFSNAVLMAVHAEESVPQTDQNSIDLSEFMPTRSPVKRGWVISLILGLMAGLLWTQLGVSLPDVEMRSDLPAMLEQSWALYSLIGVLMIGSFVFLETQTY